MVALVHDLGRPERFLNMLRVVKLTSPMSVGAWILSIYGPFAGAAAAAELVRMLPEDRAAVPCGWRRTSTAAGLLAGLFAPPVAAVHAVLLSDTATPSWHAAYRELPFVFVGSAAAASAGFALVTAHATRPARPGGWPSAERDPRASRSGRWSAPWG